MEVNIEITPKRALLDEDIQILVTNLRPLHHVTLSCRVEVDSVRYYSYGYYRSDRNGTVDTYKMPALPGGSYDGIEPMGFIWGQKQEPGQKPGRRLAKSDVTTPIETRVYILDGRVVSADCLGSIAKGNWLACSSCDRLHMAEGVQRIEIEDVELMGTLFVPDGPGPFPGVIDLFGTIGGIVEYRSALFASRGLVSLALCYYFPDGDEWVKSRIEYFEEAADYLLNHPKVVKPRVGIVGVSKGADMAMLVASILREKIGACVDINGIDVVNGLDYTYKGRTIPSCFLDFSLNYRVEEGLVFTPVFGNITEEEHEEYAIPVEEGSCNYLLLHSADDCSVRPSAAEYVPKRLERFGKTNYRVIMYPGAGHLVEPPHSPHFYATYHSLFSEVAVWGGNPKEHARAQEDSWKQMLTFFKSNLQQNRSVYEMRAKNKL